VLSIDKFSLKTDGAIFKIPATNGAGDDVSFGTKCGKRGITIGRSGVRPRTPSGRNAIVVGAGKEGVTVKLDVGKSRAF